MDRKLASLLVVLALGGTTSACSGGGGIRQEPGAAASSAAAIGDQATTTTNPSVVAGDGAPAASDPSPVTVPAPAATPADPAAAAPTTAPADPAAAATIAPAASAGAATSPPASAFPVFRGDDSDMPSWGGWGWGNDPADAIAKAGFDWFETGYPDTSMSSVNATLAAAGVRPFAYINLGELDPSLASLAGYTGQVLDTNSSWGTQLIDVTDPSWQAWILRRTEQAYGEGSRGVKWDVATPDVPPGKTRDDVNAAIASIMQRIRASHPDMKFVYNQGASFVLAHPELADGFENEGLFSASSYAVAWLQPWLDPYYWGPQYQEAVAIRALHIPVIDAEYFDPSSTQAQQLYPAIVAAGFVPYITNVDWNIRGWGYGVPPGW